MRRYQNPTPKRVKVGRRWVWRIQYRDLNMTCRTKVLGRCAEMTRSQAEAAAAEILRPINATVEHVRPAPVTFGDFVRCVYLPFARNKWKRSTAMTTEPRILLHLVSAFDSRLVSTLRREEMQQLLEAKAKTLCFHVVNHLRWDLKAIFDLATAEGVASRNPTAALYTPSCKPGRKYWELTPHDVVCMLEVLDLRERLIVRLSVIEGMRPGEIFALRWRNVGDQHITVEQRVYRGDLDTPKPPKSVREVALSPGTTEDLTAWRQTSRDTSPDAFVFPSERLTSPLSRDNVWRRSIQPRFNKVGLGWANFQAMRRANTSLGRKYGLDDKVAADQRGHGVGVAIEVYACSDLAQKIAAVRKLEYAVLQQGGMHSKREASQERCKVWTQEREAHPGTAVGS